MDIHKCNVNFTGMKPVILSILVLLAVGLVQSHPPDNALTTQERADGWQLLFNGKDLTGWKNGQQVLTYDRRRYEFEQARQLSKFKAVKPSFGSANTGHILLQDHGDTVSFKT